MKHLYMLTVLVAALTSGCTANVIHTSATDCGTGIRYYQASPYLLIYTNSKGGLKWQILYLPDQTKKMMAEPKVIGGRSELTMYFQNGVLTSSTEIGDTTALPKAIIATIQSAVPLLAKAAFSAPQPKVPAPYLYKIVVADGTIHFYGSQGDVPIIVPTLKGS
jgi:uncharacterized protein YceK